MRLHASVSGGGFKKTIEITQLRIGLVGCSSQKAFGPAPAKDLYGSALFRAARAYVERTCTRWYILSAKYGLLEPDRVIAPYDVKMQRSGAAKWGRLVGEQLDAQIPELAADLIVLAGVRYADPIETADREFYWSEPLRGLGIGARIAWLKTNTPGAA